MADDAGTSLKGRVSAEEWQARVDCAALYRLVALHGWDDMIFTHISMRVPGPDHHFLINPYGLFFEEITASSLVKVDLDGNIVDLGLVSEVLSKADRAYFSITVPAARAEELEPLRQAAEKVVRDIAGIASVTAVLTADAPRGGAVRPAGGAKVPESARVQAARVRGAAGVPWPKSSGA